MGRRSWTQESIDLLRSMWNCGHSGGQIGLELGVTRNSVIGKAHRMGLSKPREFRHDPAKRLWAEIAPPIPGSVDVPILAPMPAPELNRHLILMELTDNSCRWPIGDPLHEDFAFCGATKPDDRQYCDEHSRIAYAPSLPRRGVLYRKEWAK